MENAYWQTDCIIGIVEGDLAQPHQLKIQFRSTLEKVDRINYSHRYSFDPFTFSLQNQSLPFTLLISHFHLSLLLCCPEIHLPHTKRCGIFKQP